MAFVPPKDRVMETSISNSQTVFALAGAVDTSFNRFSASMAVGDTTVGAVVEPGVAFKSGILTYSATNQVTIDSTGFESKGTFSSGGTKEVFMGLPAKSALMVDGAQSLTSTQKNQILTNIGSVGTDVAQSLSTAQKKQGLANLGVFPILRSYLAGLALSVPGVLSGNFVIDPGVATDSSNADVMSLAAQMLKTTASWVAGGGQGGLDTGSIAANTWYHAHLIKHPGINQVDALFSLSATAPTLPSGYTLFRRIGSMRTNGTQQWWKFVQRGDEFLWDVASLDVNFAGTTAIQVASLKVPTGLIVNALLNVGGIGPGTGAGQGRAWVFSPAINSAGDLASPSTSFNAGIFTSAPGSQNWTGLNIRTNSVGQVYYSTEISSMSLQIFTHGWIDRRGRDD